MGKNRTSGPEPTDKATPDRDSHRLMVCNLIFLGVMVVLFVGLFFVICGHPEQRGLLVVAAGFVGVGALVGFLFSSYSGEKENLSPITAAVHGLIGGAALTDISKEDSMIRHVFHALAGSGNLPEGTHGLVIAIGAAFAPVGFFFLYLNRKLDFNLAAVLQDSRINEASQTLAASLTPSVDDVQRSAELKGAAKAFLKQSKKDAPETFEEKLNEGKAHFTLDDYQKAVASFKRALELRPGHPDASIFLAAALSRLQNYEAATQVLQSLIQNPQAPVDAFRLLGYVLLFTPPESPNHEARIRQAIEATDKYLAVHPDDAGAKVNLACAYAQLGTDDPGNVDKVREILTPLLPASTEAKELVASLTTEGEDFQEYTKFDWFKKLL